MRHYAHLTQDQRYQIYALRKEKISLAQIASNIGVHKSTVSRELRRNQGAYHYYPAQAQRMAQDRAAGKQSPRIASQTWQFVNQQLRKRWSPQQISGRLKAMGLPCLSHETIYRYVAWDKSRNGNLYKFLRRAAKKRRPYAQYRRAGPLANRVSIELRPPEGELNNRIGDWEADTIVGPGKQALLCLVERRSCLSRIVRIERKGAEDVRQAFLAALGPLAQQVKTITSDNGAEFARHEKIAASLEASFFFAHPYSAWERGLNENTNGLIRQFFPKKTHFGQVSQEQVKEAEESLNNRPRKGLGFKTPNEVFYQSVSVALES